MKLFKLPVLDNGSCVAVNPYDIVSIELKVKDGLSSVDIYLSNGKFVAYTNVPPKEATELVDQLIEASDAAKEVAPKDETANTPE